jgi:glycosyltransferase involved in cell wall biosynthesis
MRKRHATDRTDTTARQAGQDVPKSEETRELRRRLTEVEAELSFYRSKHEWLQAALASQSRARQMLEASLAAGYQSTIARIRDTVCALIPEGATVVVISKGDQELLQLQARCAWHFPQCEDGGYAGYYPADSTAAIAHSDALIAKGAEFLLIPNTAFWWLEHYRDWAEWLAHFHAQIWRDERCAIYRLLPAGPEKSCVRAGNEVTRKIEAETGSRWLGANAELPREAGGRSLSIQCSSRIPGARFREGADSRPAPQILCFPIIDWGFRFQRPQHLMRQFAEAGWRVFYLSHQFRKSGELYAVQPLGALLWELSLLGPRCNVRHGFLDEAHCDRLTVGLLKWRQDYPAETSVVVVQSPFWWPLIRQLSPAFAWPVVYDCMDDHAGFATSNPLLIEQERELLAQADLVVASSAVLDKAARRYNRNVLLVRNGCEYEHFARAQAQRQPGARPIIGYYGAIAEWFDSGLLAELAEKRADWDFLLVGSTFGADLGRLARLSNVCFTGEKPYAELPRWLAKFDVAILPFKRTRLTEAANPVKAYEILAGGKPLVSVPLPEIALLAPLVRLAATAREFESEIEAELKRTSAHWERKRRQFAIANTWRQRFALFSTAVKNLVARPSLARPAAAESKLSPIPIA